MDITSSIKKYKNSVTRKYISLSNDEIDVITKGDYWFSRKYDGQLWFYCKSNKNSKIINSNENDISTLTGEIKKELDKKLSKTKNIILAGELYYLTNERERYGDTISGLGDKSKRKNLRLGVFDIVISDKLLSSFEEKYKFLKKNLGENSKNLSFPYLFTKLSGSKLFSKRRNEIFLSGFNSSIIFSAALNAAL